MGTEIKPVHIMLLAGSRTIMVFAFWASQEKNSDVAKELGLSAGAYNELEKADAALTLPHRHGSIILSFSKGRPGFEQNIEQTFDPNRLNALGYRVKHGDMANGIRYWEKINLPAEPNAPGSG